MAHRYGPKIVRDSSLVFAMDGANTKSSKSEVRTDDVVNFNGTDHYFETDNSDFLFGSGQDITFSFWVRLDETIADGTEVFFGIIGGGSNEYYCYTTAAALAFGFSDDGGSVDQTVSTGGVGVQLQQDIWSHGVITYDSSTQDLKVYLDGTLRKTNATALPPQGLSTAPFRVGSYTGGNLWPGKMRGFGFWKRTLSDFEVSLLYDMGRGTRGSDLTKNLKNDLVSFYDLIGDSSQKIVDNIGNNTLTIQGTAGEFNDVDAPFKLQQDLIDRNGFLTQNGAVLTDGAWDFDGVNDYLDFGNSYTDDVKCIDIWFNSDLIITNAELYNGVGGGIIRWSITGVGNGVNIGRYTSLYQTDEVIGIWNQNGDLKSTYIRGDDLLPNTWYNIVINWNGSTYDFYKNGVSEPAYASTLGHCPLITSPTGLAVGRNVLYFFNGKISNVKIYNRELTAQEIKNNYDEMKYRFL